VNRRHPGARALPLALAWTALLFAASAGARPLFQTDTTLAVTLHAPWTDILKDTGNRSRHPATLEVLDPDGNSQRIEGTVETRGITRLRICRFPPLRIRFASGAANGTVFAGQRSLKLVTHCQNARRYEQYYVLELLAYRIYNQVSDDSFRVRPLSISYQDRRGPPDGPRFAFLIEHVNEVARRSAASRVRRAELAPQEFDAAALTRLALFQYLIGNTDFEVLSGPQPNDCCHNVRVLDAGRGLIALPYDFDSAGMVDASYAAPHERLPIREVRQRLYRGFCAHNDQLEPVRQEFLRHEPAIRALIEGEERLTSRNRTSTLRYIDEFYATLNSPLRFRAEVSGKCRR
jgi:hypothetical protein